MTYEGQALYHLKVLHPHASVIIPDNTFNNVDFPQPDGPIIAQISSVL